MQNRLVRAITKSEQNDLQRVAPRGLQIMKIFIFSDDQSKGSPCSQPMDW